MKVVVTGGNEAASYLKAIHKQVRYGLSLAVNETTDYAQVAIKAQVGRSFTLRRAEFVRNTVVRLKARGDFATKRVTTGIIRIDDRADSKGNTRDFLGKFVEGGVKRSRSGSNVAVPVSAPRNASGIVTNANRPRQLMGKKNIERITTDRGKDLIVKFGGRGARARVTVLYALKPRVRIRAQFPMFTVADRAVSASWPVAVENGLTNAFATAR